MERKKTPFKNLWILFPAVLILMAGIFWRIWNEYQTSFFTDRDNYIFSFNNAILNIDSKNSKVIIVNEPILVPVDIKLPFDLPSKVQTGDLTKIFFAVPLNFFDWARVEKALFGAKIEYSSTVQTFWEEKIISEHLRVEVLNADGEPGIANKTADLLTNMGMDIVNVGNFEGKVDQCKILTENKNWYSVKRVEQVLGCSVELKPSGQRTQVTILLNSLRPREWHR